MKKLSTILFSGLYVILSIGVFKSEHLCGGVVKSTAYFSAEAEKCFEGEEKRDMTGCCSDETEVFQLADEHIPGAFIQIADFSTDFTFTVFSATFSDFNNTVFKEEAGLAYDLPPPNPVPVYILLSSLTFYG